MRKGKVSVKRQRVGLAMAAGAACATMVIPNLAMGVIRTWTPGTNDFNLNTNWGGTTPGVADIATITGVVTTQPNVTSDITISGINFSSATTTGWNITGTSAAEEITLMSTSTSSTGAINSVASTGTNTISASLILGSSGTQTFTAASGGTLLINGGIGGTGALAFAGAGTHKLAGDNTFAGGASLVSGTVLHINSNTALGTGTFTISGGQFDNSSGGVVTLINNNAMIWSGNLQFNGTNALNLGNGAISLGTTAGPTRTLTVSGTLSAGGVISDGVNATPATGLIKAGSGVLILGGNNLFTGGVTVSAGTLQLNGSNAYAGATSVAASSVLQVGGAGGSILNSNNIGVAGAGSLILDNTGVGNNVANRIADGQGIVLNSASLIFKGSDQAASPSSETLGAITALPGTNIITSTFGGTNAADLTLASLSHTVGVTPVVLVNGLSLGKDSGTTSVGRVFLTAAPTLVGTSVALATGDGTDGNGAGAAKNTVIVPYLVGETTTTASGKGTATGNANTFLTYNATTGLRPLNSTDEFENWTGTVTTSSAGNNVRVAATATYNPSAAGTSINSLVISGASATLGTAGVAKTLTIASGAMLVTSSHGIVAPNTASTVDMGGGEAFFTVTSGAGANNAAMLTGFTTATKSGAGTYTQQGATSVTGGAILLSNVSAGNLIFTGNFTSTNVGDLTLKANLNGNVQLLGTTTSVKGAITNSGTGTASNQITGNVGLGVTAINQNAITSSLTMSGVNSTFVAPINVQAGVFQFGTDGSLGDADNDIFMSAGTTLGGNSGMASAAGGAHTVTINGAAAFGGGNSVHLGGVVAGTGPVALTNGTTMLSNNNTWTGNINTGAGRVMISTDSNLGNSSNALTLVSSQGTFSVVGTQYTGFGSRTLALNGGNSGSTIIDIQDAGNTFVWDRNFNTSINSGGTTGSFVKTGAGTVEFTVAQTANNATGATWTSNGGEMRINAGAGGSVPTVSGSRLAFGGGTLRLLGGGANRTQTVGDLYRVDSGGGTIIVDNAGSAFATTLNIGNIATTFNAGSSLNFRTVNVGAGSATITTTVANVGGIIGAGRATWQGTSFATNTGVGNAIGAYTLASAFVGSGANSATNYALTGDGTVTASESVNTLQLGTSGAGATLGLGTQILTVTTGGILFNNADAYTVSGGTLKSNSGTNSDLIIHAGGTGVVTLATTIATGTGTSTLTKTGDGTVVLTVNNTYTGATYINKGVLSISNNLQLGTTTNATLGINGGTLQVTESMTTGRAFVFGGSGATFDVADSKSVTITSALNSGQSSANAAGTLTLNNSGTGSGVLRLENASNALFGGVSINSGTLQMGANGAIPTAGYASLAFGSGTTAKLQVFGARTLAVAGLKSSNTAAVVENGATGAGLFHVINGADYSYAGSIQNGAAGTLAFSKSGGGSLTLAGATNAYSGATNIYSGTLALAAASNNIANTPTITVYSGGTLNVAGVTGFTLASGQTLRGNGTVSGAMTAGTGSIIAPGMSVGTLSTSGLTMTGGSKYQVEVNAATNTAADRAIVANGAVDLGSGVATLVLRLLGGLQGSYTQSFVLIDNISGLGTTGYFAGLDPNADAVPDTIATFNGAGGSYTVDYAGGTGNDVVLTYSSVPEPGSLAALALGGAALLGRRRRRSR